MDNEEGSTKGLSNLLLNNWMNWKQEKEVTINCHSEAVFP
jgi:hypothetical protein